MTVFTLSDVIDTSVAAERAAERLYLGLAAKFARYPDLVDYWQEYAREERQHATWLETLCDRVAPEEMGRLVDLATTQMVQTVANFSVEKALGQVRTLEDAYQLVTEIENSETNAIFNFVINNIDIDSTTADFLRSQLHEHVSQLSHRLPVQYVSQVSRQLILADG